MWVDEALLAWFQLVRCKRFFSCHVALQGIIGTVEFSVHNIGVTKAESLFLSGDKIKNYFRNSLYYLDKTSNFAMCLYTCCPEFYF